MSDHRLPRNVLPRRYTLEVRPDLEDGKFSGLVAIEVDVVAGASEVVLNCVDLDLAGATITDAEGTVHPQLALDAERERVVLGAGRGLAAGPALVEMAFAGRLDERLRGFYSSRLATPDGTSATIATTQFQSTDARRAFPCFDEPDMKAAFAVTLVVPEGVLAVSNGAEESRTPLGDGTDRVVFAETIPLSTYLVAFVVGPLEATQPVDVDGIPVRVVHPPGRGHLAGFALEVAEHSLRFFREWYGIDVPGGKVDLVALPDFAFGAMENLGCITFREVLLLVDPEAATQRELESVAAVLSHELAHLWFGDLVTMEWWNGIWLNEAFATFMELKAVESFRPAWEVWAGFGAARAAALDVDALAATRPIEYPVVTPADAEGMFDLLTYEKGAAVVRMLEQYLGEEPFRDGVRLYLRRHLYGNTANDDLWDALEEASGEPVRDLMHGWILQGGHPVVRGTLEEDGGAGAVQGVRRLALTQRPFRYDGRDDGSRWSVPVRVRTPGGLQRVLVPPGDGVTITLEADPLTLNADATGFHRCDPPAFGDTDTLAALSAPERAAFVDDSWALVLAGSREPAWFLESVRPLAGDPDLSVWQAIVRALSTIDLVAPSLRPVLAAEAGSLLRSQVAQLGWEPSAGEDDRTRQLRGLVLSAAGTLADNEAVVSGALSRWADPAGSDPPVAAAVVTITASHGDAACFDECWRRYREAATAQDEQRHLRALALFPGRTEVDRLLAELTGRGIRSQDTPYLLRDLLHHRHHREVAWRTLTGRWDELVASLPSNSIARMLEGVRAQVAGDTDPDVDAFLDAHPVPQGDLIVAQHRERRLVNVHLAGRLETAGLSGSG